MYEQFLFYWLHWVIFIIVACFMQINITRSFFMIWILLIISCSNITFQLGSIDVSLSYVILFIGAFIYFVQYPLSLYKWITTFTVMTGYVALLIWEKITPVWFFISSYFLIPFLVAMLIVILFQTLLEQISIVVVSLSLGQLLFDLLLISYQLNDVLVEENFFIFVSSVTLNLILFHIIRMTIFTIRNIVHRKMST